MGTENASRIDQLDPLKPTGGEDANLSDDYHRQVKKAVQGTFPLLTGTVLASHAELNRLVGVGYDLKTARGALVVEVGGTTVADTSVVIPDWDQEAYDTDTIHDNSTNPSRLTVPAGAAKVRLTANILWNVISSPCVIEVEIVKNTSANYRGVGRATQYVQASAVRAVSQSVSTAVIDVVAGDYFEVKLFQTSGSSQSTNAYSSFCMEIISEA